MARFEVLSKSPVFAGIETSRLESLFSGIHFQVRKYKKGDVIANAGETLAALYILQKGSVTGEMADYSGKTLKIEDIETPKPLASAFLFGARNRFPVTAIANDEVELVVIPKPEFLKLLQSDRQILSNYLDAISSRTQFLSEKLHFLSFRSIRQKVAHFFLQQAGSVFHSVEIKQTQEQLASLFGVSRPALARVLIEMQAEGLFEIDRKTVKLLDKERLNQILRNE